MTAIISSLGIKDASGNTKPVQTIDTSGVGNGPFITTHALVDKNGVLISNTNALSVSFDALPAGGNKIGSVDIATLPATAAKDATVASITTALGSPLQAGGNVVVTGLPSLPAGSNAIGSVSVNNLPATQAVSAVSLPLPSGASTSALQGTANASLASIDGKVPALVGGRTPVDGSGVVQPISASSLPLPAGASTSALQTTGNASLATIANAITSVMTIQGSVTVSDGTGPLTVDGTVNVGNFPATQAISASALPLPTGAASSALQTTGNTSLNSIDGKLPASLGQKAAAASISTDQASNGVIATAYGTLADTVTSDLTATGASFTFTSLLKGIVANGFSLLSRLPASLGIKSSAASLSVAPASDAIFVASGSASVGSAPVTPPLSVSGVDNTGLKRHLLTDTSGNQIVILKPFQPLPGSTKSVTVGQTATTAGALPLAANGVIVAGTATAYRVRNAATSASAVTWILTTDANKTPTIPTPYAADGTGGSLGDKTIDPGSVEVISLSANQQTALAAGTLYISAVTAAGGSAILSITPGVGA